MHDEILPPLADVGAFTFSIGQSVTSIELSSWSWKPNQARLTHEVSFDANRAFTGVANRREGGPSKASRDDSES